MRTNDEHEREVKFYISDLHTITARLSAVGAVLIKERVHELNYRFDTDEQKLRSLHQVLRLRQDEQSHLTFKGQSDLSQGIVDRMELETIVSDLTTTKKILEALGFQVFLVYEKSRTTYAYKDCEIVLDELPFGFFMEIEGESTEAIQRVANDLGFNWEKRILLSYLEMFSKLKTNKKLDIDNITFDSFINTKFTELDFI